MTTPRHISRIRKKKHSRQGDRPLAIVGMGLRLPGEATDPKSFWSLLVNGVDAISEIPEDRWSITSFYDPRPNMPGQSHSKWGGFIDGNALFDASFFSVSPHEAESMDPQQRLLLETAWHTFEDAGEIPNRSAAANVGVYVGISYNEYARFAVSPVDHVYSVSQGSGAFDATGTAMSIAANRISHAFNFKGPSMAIDTACSSSLVAFNEACRAVWDGECESALVAGVNHIVDPSTWIAFCSLGALSPDGRCKAFDATANGFVRGEGVGAVFVKPLEDAVRDRNRIYATVRGTAVNQDGYTPAIAMPNRVSQEALIRHTCDLAGVSPDQIDFVEAHGTGTGVGDPIEANALGNALGVNRSSRHPLYISSVKTNIGHLESAAGIAGLIKASLCLYHRQLPRSLHFQTPNPAVDFDALNLHVVTENFDLSGLGRKSLLASVNSFGFGGANAHAILESAPDLSATKASPAAGRVEGRYLLSLSARSPVSLRRLASDYVGKIEKDPKHLPGIAAAALQKRAPLSQRLTVVASNRKQLLSKLETFSRVEDESELPEGIFLESAQLPPDTKPVFVFSGQGSQWAGMGEELYEHSDLFRKTFDRCHSALRRISRGSFHLRDEVFASKRKSHLTNTAVAQPAIFAMQVSLAKLWEAWGIHPSAVVGHSVGEVAAAHVAGALDFEDAIRVIYHRGTKMESARFGRMLAAEITPADARKAIQSNGGGLSLAACNGPTSVSISGEPDAVEHLYEMLQERNVFCRYVPVDYAFHSDLMDPVRNRLLQSLKGIHPKRSQIPIYSTVTGGKLSGTRFTPEYWWKNVRETVEFSKVIETLAGKGNSLFLEINSHPVLQPSLVQCLRKSALEGGSHVLPSMRRDASSRDTLLGSLGQLHNKGISIDWSGLLGKPDAATNLPLYPFDQQRYWRETPAWKSARLTPRPHPYLHVDIPSPRSEWMFFPDRREHPYLNDHVVSDRIVFPASGYIEMALAVARNHYQSSHLVLEEVEFQRVLFIPRDGPAAVLRAEFEPDKGIFRILSTSDEKRQTWTLHALGRIRQQTSTEESPPADPNRIAGAKKRCPKPTDISEAYELLENSGLRYGPLFRGLTEAAFSDSEGWSHIRIPEAIRNISDGYLLHPVLLDSAFHVMALLPNKTPGTFLPVELRRLRIYQANAKQAYCHARLIYSTPSMYETDITLIDENGGLIAELSGFRLLAVESARADHIPDVTFDFIEEQWIESPAKEEEGTATTAGLNLPSPSSLVSLLRKLQGGSSTCFEPIENHSPLYALAIQRSLAALGFAKNPGEKFTLEDLREELTIPVRNESILLRPLRILEKDGVLRLLSPGRWKLLQPLAPGEFVTTWKRFLEAAPDLSTELILLALISDHLDQILSGKTTTRTLLHEKSNSHLPDQLFGESAWIQPLHRAVGDTLAKMIEGLSQGERMTITELECGSRQTAAYLLSRLPSEKVLYHLTDGDPDQLAAVVDKLHPFENLTSEVFTPRRSLGAQDATPASADVIVWNHPETLSQTALRRVRQLLRPGGILILSTEKEPSHFLNFVQWLDRKNPVSGLSAREMNALLEGAGFEAVSHFSTASSPGHRILFGRAAALPARASKSKSAETKSAKKGHWLLFPDPSGTVAGTFRNYLEESGKSVHLVSPPDLPTSREHCIEYLTSLRFSPEGILYLGALGTTLSPRTSPNGLQKSLGPVCLTPLFIAQALDSLSKQPSSTSFWLATAQGRSIPGSSGMLDPIQTSLAGMTRVIHSELRSHRVRHIDLSVDPEETEIRSCCFDLVSGTEETQCAYRGHSRFVPRLQTTSPHSQRKTKRLPLHDSPAQLITRQAGVFDHLTLQEIDRIPPAKGEVEVEIHAAGLNFRDVMKSLGIYPSDAEDAGLFGDDFAGVITNVGPGVRHFKPGDRVFGVRPGCFRTHLTVPAALLLPLPNAISFEGASTIPSVYLTAWYALHEVGRMEKGERVLIHAGAGGVGLAAIRLAQHAGAEVFATAGSPLKREFLKRLGVDHVFDSRTLTFADEIFETTDGAGVDIVLNSLAGQAITKSLECLREGGRFLELGKRDIYENTEVGLRPFKNCLTYVAIDLARQISPARFKVLVGKVRKLVDREIITPLPHTVFPIVRAQDAFRHMAQGRHIGKIVFTFDNQEATPEPKLLRDPFALSSEGTYLITGGTHGFGLEVAAFLAERGARHLVLASRSGGDIHKQNNLPDALTSSQMQVEFRACDVSSPGELEALLSSIRECMPPLKGIFHAAMVLRDEVLTRMTGEQVEEVAAPKIAGAWNLHRQTKKDPIDHFVLFSSISVLVGNPGQANYVSANAFLDGLAIYRRQTGLPGLSIAWDRLNESGYAARTEGLAEHFDRLGWKGLNNREALRGLELLMQNEAVHMAVSNVDWSKWQSAAGLSGRIPFYENLITEDSGDGTGGDLADRVRQQFFAAAPEERIELVEGFIIEQVAKVLRISPNRLSKTKPLNEQGLDSLMAVELFGVLENQLGVPIPPSQLIENPTVEKAAVSIAHILETQEASPTSHQGTESSIAEPPAEIPITPQEDLDQLSNTIRVDCRPDGPALSQSPRNIFLTGVTGLFGPHLLHSLLKTTDARIHCLVRSKTATAGLRRIRARMSEAGLKLSRKTWSDRVCAVAGDLSLPTLGLSEKRWNHLAEETDTIIHGAATVNHSAPYSEIRSSDVLGTVELIRLASQKRTKHLHYLSSLAVFSTNSSSVFSRKETDLPDQVDELFNGYGQGKAVSETLLRTAEELGIPVSIFRMGHLVSASEPLASASKQALWLVLRACLYLEFAPNYRSNLQITPVDWAAETIARAVQTRIPPATRHVASSFVKSFEDLLSFARSLGYEVETLDRSDWVSRLNQLEEAQHSSLYGRFFPKMEIAAIPVSDAGLLDDRQFRRFLDQLPEDESSFPSESWDAEGLVRALQELGFFPEKPSKHSPNSERTAASL
ncbi:MAG: thioester reductase domain-containing protein [Verrucomicrobiales bacterium]|nr:thioester reductase domain-containing protein [Verrucomicrobiales bacterium]